MLKMLKNLKEGDRISLSLPDICQIGRTKVFTNQSIVTAFTEEQIQQIKQYICDKYGLQIVREQVFMTKFEKIDALAVLIQQINFLKIGGVPVHVSKTAYKYLKKTNSEALTSILDDEELVITENELNTHYVITKNKKIDYYGVFIKDVDKLKHGYKVVSFDMMEKILNEIIYNRSRFFELLKRSYNVNIIQGDGEYWRIEVIKDRLLYDSFIKVVKSSDNFTIKPDRFERFASFMGMSIDHFIQKLHNEYGVKFVNVKGEYRLTHPTKVTMRAFDKLINKIRKKKSVKISKSMLGFAAKHLNMTIDEFTKWMITVFENIRVITNSGDDAYRIMHGDNIDVLKSLLKDNNPLSIDRVTIDSMFKASHTTSVNDFLTYVNTQLNTTSESHRDGIEFTRIQSREQQKRDQIKKYQKGVKKLRALVKNKQFNVDEFNLMSVYIAKIIRLRNELKEYKYASSSVGNL